MRSTHEVRQLPQICSIKPILLATSGISNLRLTFQLHHLLYWYIIIIDFRSTLHIIPLVVVWITNNVFLLNWKVKQCVELIRKLTACWLICKVRKDERCDRITLSNDIVCSIMKLGNRRTKCEVCFVLQQLNVESH